MQNYDLGNRIYELRKASGLSQKELGALIGVSNKAVSKWETGAAVPKTETVIKLASVFGITAEELLCAKSPEVEKLDTLEALSNKTANIFLQNKLNTYEAENKNAKYKKAKTYLICIICLFVSFAAISMTLGYINNNIVIPQYQEQFPEIYAGYENDFTVKDNIFLSVGMGYVICSIYTGITLLANLIKKMPSWVTAIACVLFPVTILFIELSGMVMVVPKIIMSIITIIQKGKDKNG